MCRDDNDDGRRCEDCRWKSRRAKVSAVVVRLCQLDEAARRRRPVVVSGTPTATWRFPRSNEAEASLHADARRLRETAAQEITRAGRANPPRPGVETARHGTSGTCVSRICKSLTHPSPHYVIFRPDERARARAPILLCTCDDQNTPRRKIFPRLFAESRIFSRVVKCCADTFLSIGNRIPYWYYIPVIFLKYRGPGFTSVYNAVVFFCEQLFTLAYPKVGFGLSSAWM